MAIFNSAWGRPENVPVRPLNKGMFRDRVSNGIPPGGYWDIINYHCQDYGLKRRGGWNPIFEPTSTEANLIRKKEEAILEPIVDVFTLESNGVKETLVLTEERLFLITKDGITEKQIELADTGTTWAIVDGNIVATLGSLATDNIRSYLPGYAGTTVVGEILSVTATTVTISNIDGLTDTSTLTGLNFKTYDRWLGYRGLHASHTYVPGSFDKAIITSANGTLYSYDSTNELQRFILEGRDASPAPIAGARVITEFSDRLWLGNVDESGIQRRRRIYWSELGQYDTVYAESYVDLPESEGELISLKQLGTLLIAYFEDSIYIGRPTQLIGLPYKFEKFDASDLGIVSNKAVISWLDGHFLVLNDDIYYFSNNLALQAIGSSVKDLTVRPCSEANLMPYVMIAPDVFNESVTFFFPEALASADGRNGAAVNLWRYHYPTQAWSRDRARVNETGIPRYYFTGVFSSYFYTVDKTWQDWIDDGGYEPGDPLMDANGAVAWIGGNNVNWADYRYWFELSQETIVNKTLYLSLTQGTNQGLYFEGSNGYDEIYSEQVGIREYLEGGDFDLNSPDQDKTVTRCSVKLRDFTDNAFNLSFATSNNRGRSFREQGNLRFRTDEDEGRVDFLSTGSNFRYSITGSPLTFREPYEIMEYVLRISGRGLQTDDI